MCKHNLHIRWFYNRNIYLYMMYIHHIIVNLPDASLSLSFFLFHLISQFIYFRFKLNSILYELRLFKKYSITHFKCLIWNLIEINSILFKKNKFYSSILYSIQVEVGVYQNYFTIHDFTIDVDLKLYDDSLFLLRKASTTELLLIVNPSLFTIKK